MFANTTYASLSGTNVYWDFVELPSQFMENFAVEKEFLHTFARHYQTGELIPDELVQRIVDSRNFNAAYACLRQVSFGLLDMAWYTRTTPFEGNVMAYEKQAWARAQILPSVEGTCMSTQFSHIFAGGYSAGYYSYKWAEVLDADAFSLFKKQGIFDQKTAFSFRENILSQGGTEHPMTLYKRFRGQACNNKDDVMEIFTGKTWKLTRLTTEGSSNRFLSGLWDNENSYNNSIEKLNSSGNYILNFYGDNQSAELIEPKFNANGINAKITNGTWKADGISKELVLSGKVTGAETDPLAKEFMKALLLIYKYEGDNRTLTLYYKDGKINKIMGFIAQ